MSFKTLILAATSVAALALPAFAQSYPDRAVTIVVGNNPGGGIDAMARRVADALSTKWGQPVVVENRPGADGTVAAILVAEAAKDGYTLLMASNGFTLAPLQMETSYDPVTSFTHIMQVADMPLVLAANPASRVSKAEELIEKANANPNTFNGGASGNANATFNALTQLVKQSGADIEVIPYTGAAAMMTALLANEVQVGFSSIAGIAPQLLSEGGTLQPLALTAKERSHRLPEVPTVKEAFGLDDFELWSAWYGLFAPAGVDPALADKINADLRDALENGGLGDALKADGMTLIASTPAELKATMEMHGEKFPGLLGLEKK